VDDKGKFRVDNFDAMKANLGEGQPLAKDGERKPKGNDQRKEKDSAKGKRDKKPQGPSLDKELDRLVRLIKEKKMEPVIVFSFSRR
jgi:superfamily II RNA helicase